MTNLNAQTEPNLLEDAQNYFSGHSSIPFPILPNSPFYEEEVFIIFYLHILDYKGKIKYFLFSRTEPKEKFL